MMSTKAKKPKTKRTHLGRLYSRRRKKIMKITLVFHVGEDHEDRRTPTHI
jgi:hypothetical protein